jgi:hypothetical protein
MQADGRSSPRAPDNGSKYDFAVARYSPDGTLDATFGGTSSHHLDGRATTPTSCVRRKIVAAGYSLNVANAVFAVVRYNPDGAR